ncbi:hypothetical protein BKA59DRAFT_527378 [Fusarium tricinctum]|uniref:Uncharacterized protein n=1 Tax=Fusarium tricinctum TaxID=61284 RepID=A0A8K0WBP7_9HYPO|nr:hypothetical protein BKA59DRAFT_527378 [Fusarium tricinctum]
MDCSLSRLESLVENEEVEFDADIAGIGVLIAFLATSLVAFITLLAAYTTLSVPPQLCNSGDTILSTHLRDYLRKLRRKLPKLKRVNVVDSQNERIDAFMAFMLSISDQILVSQVAILIAAFIIHVEITIYSVNIVIALGCLASTVHLGSFPFYIDRLRDHGTAKMVRVIAMAAGSGMLAFVLIIQLSYTWDMETHVYFTCVLHDFQIRGDDITGRIIELFVPISVLYGTYEIVQLLYTNQSPKSITTPSSVAQSSEQPNNAVLRQLEEQPLGRVGEDLNIIKRESELLRRLLRLVDQEEPGSVTNSTDTSDIPLHGIAQRSDSREMQPDMDQYTYAQLKTSFLKPNLSKMSCKDIWRQTRESERDALLSKWLQLEALNLLVSHPKSNFHLKAQVYRVAERLAFHQCRGSFMWRLLWLWSGNVYGIVTVFVSRSNRTGLSGDPDHWGFGQIVPLALLALPLFAAMESHADYKRNIKAITIKNHTSPSGPVLVPGVVVDINSPDGLSKNDREATNYVRKVGEALQKRAKDMGHPELYQWIRGQELKDSPSIESAVVLHTIFMSSFTTSMGLYMALGLLWAKVILIPLLFILTGRRAADLVWMAKHTRTGPAVLKYLGTISLSEFQQGGDHGERMMVAQAAGEVEEDS